MSTFQANFETLEKELEKRHIKEYEELIALINELLIPPSIDNQRKHAIIVLGYSGNGKSTWIRNFCNEIDGYEILSWDQEIVKILNGRSYKEIGHNEQLRTINNALDRVYETEKNLILDGNYLNLPLRATMINTLREAGYRISIVDLTPNINNTLKYRINDEYKKYRAHPNFKNISDAELYASVAKMIYDFKENEEQRSSFKIQEKHKVVDIGVDHYFTYESTPSEVAKSYNIAL